MLKHCPNIQGYHYCDCQEDCQARKDLQETWENIEQEYLKEEYPVFGAPYNAMTFIEWLNKYYHIPKRK